VAGLALVSRQSRSPWGLVRHQITTCARWGMRTFASPGLHADVSRQPPAPRGRVRHPLISFAPLLTGAAQACIAPSVTGTHFTKETTGLWQGRHRFHGNHGPHGDLCAIRFPPVLAGARARLHRPACTRSVSRQHRPRGAVCAIGLAPLLAGAAQAASLRQRPPLWGPAGAPALGQEPPAVPPLTGPCLHGAWPTATTYG